MEKKSQDFSMQEAQRLANSPAGQQLLAMLRAADSTELDRVAAEAASGNYAGAAKALSKLLSTEEAQKLLAELGR